MKPTVSYKEFTNQAMRTLEELQELLHMIDDETLPFMVINLLNDDRIGEIRKAVEVLKAITSR